MIWYLLVGVVIGFAIGKLDAIRHIMKLRKSLNPEDEKRVRELLHAAQSKVPR